MLGMYLINCQAGITIQLFLKKNLIGKPNWRGRGEGCRERDVFCPTKLPQFVMRTALVCFTDNLTQLAGSLGVNPCTGPIPVAWSSIGHSHCHYHVMKVQVSAQPVSLLMGVESWPVPDLSSPGCHPCPNCSRVSISWFGWGLHCHDVRAFSRKANDINSNFSGSAIQM